jgi:hypothetical protein
MKGWLWGILLFELFLFALILVLPQVDLPDFTFHSGTAPIVAKARVSSPPLLTTVTVTTMSRPTLHFSQGDTQRFGLANHATPQSLLTLLCTFLC